MALGDDAFITVTCQSCGQKTDLKISWLKANNHFFCSCGDRVEVDSERLLKAHERIERQLKVMFDEYMNRR
jgi:hypothetical protein